MILSFNLNIDSILRVCHIIKKLNLHLVYVLSFFKNFLLSISFVLQKGRRIPTLGLSSNQWTGIIVSSLLGFSKSWITSFTNFVGYPALMNDCLMALTSAFQLVAILFARCKALRIVLRFHLSGMADFQCACSLPSLPTQTYFRLSLFSAEKKRLRARATSSYENDFRDVKIFFVVDQ